MNTIVEETRRKSYYLYDRERFIQELLQPIKEHIPHAAGGIIGAGSKGFDTRGIHYGYPTEYLAIYTNFDPEKFVSHYPCEPSKGYSTKASHQDIGLPGYEIMFKTLFEPFGFYHGMQTFFFKPNGAFLGVYGITRSAVTRFSDSEMELFDTISPSIFFAFMRYRWLVEADFFMSPLNKHIYAMVITDRNGRVMWKNRVSENMLESSVGAEFKEVLGESLKNSKDLLSGETAFGDFRNYSELTSIGRALVLPFNGSWLDFMPVEKDGFIIFIDQSEKYDTSVEQLSRRELEVLRLIAMGRYDKEIASMLSISERTVHAHASNIFKKLNVSNRTEAVSMGTKLGVL